MRKPIRTTLRRLVTPLLAASLPIVVAGTVVAHEFWLEASPLAAGSADTMRIAARVGTGFRGEIVPYAPARTLRLLTRGSDLQDLRGAARDGDPHLASVPRDPGGTLIGFVSTFAPIELPGEEFDAYLALEGLETVREARRRAGEEAKPGRERFRRCAKIWIAGTDAPRVEEPLGLPLEIVPLGDPSSQSPLTVLVLRNGEPLAGALVRAWNRPESRAEPPVRAARSRRLRGASSRDSVGVFTERRTDAEGRATLVLDPAGEWLLGVIDMVPSRDRNEADWESSWASLTFARAGKGS